MENQYAIEMLHITKKFPGIIANDDVTIQLKKGEIHALLGENGAGKSTLMSVLFGLYQAEEGIIKKDGKEVQIKNPNDANDLGIGMVHQHFKLVECFTVLDNIIMGVEPNKFGFLQKKEARKHCPGWFTDCWRLFCAPHLWWVCSLVAAAVMLLMIMKKTNWTSLTIKIGNPLMQKN